MNSAKIVGQLQNEVQDVVVTVPASFNPSERRFYPLEADGWVNQGINEIREAYGDTVSLIEKSKTLHKFGRTTNADSGVKTTVATFQGTEVNETFTSTNSVDSIVSTSGSDTGIVTVEGHTIDTSTGALTFAVQNVTLTGQTPASLTTPLARANRVYVTAGTFAAPASNLVGTVSVYDSTVATTAPSGVPSDATATKCVVVAGLNQSEKGATSISSTDYWLIHEIVFTLSRAVGANVNADCEVETRGIGGVWLPLGLETTIRSNGNSAIHDTMDPYMIVPKNTDVRMVVTTDAADITVSGYLRGPLLKVV